MYSYSPELIFLFLFAFIAGFIDAIVGGGGLIQMPAMFLFAPQLSVTTALGTNKFAALMGTIVAAFRYVKKTEISWSAIIPATITALIFSFLGAHVISYFNKEYIKPVIFVLLIAVAIYTFIGKNFGEVHDPHLSHKKTILYSVITGSAIGFYDGFFGPGTGSFLILIYVVVFGFNFLAASASAKLINCATNAAALSYFITTGQVNYAIAVPVAACNMIGSWIGAQLAIKKGSGFVRILFLVIVTGMILKFGYDIFLKK